MQIDPKAFDLNYTVRDSRNLYASFINLLDTNAVVMKQKYKFEKAPLELGYKDYGIFPGYQLRNIAKDIEDIELQTKNGDLSRKQMLLEVAVEQHQMLQERYQAQKGKSAEEICKAAFMIASGISHEIDKVKAIE